ESTLVQRASITPSSNTLSRQMVTDGESALSSLQSDNGADFDQAYVDLQVNEHQQVLTTLDQKLIPAAKNADLKNALIAFRPKVAEHLQHGQDLQKQIAKAAGTAAAKATH
ncbi:MAG TPA: DUF4142 domain-containing protein, partial [Polyangiaceae bacterium]